MKELGKEIRERMLSAIQDIEKKHGVCTPQHLVAAARPKTSPIHNDFEWDDQAAGEKYRIDQARYYLRKVTVIIEDVVVRGAFTAEGNMGSIPRGYISTARIMTDEDRRSNLLDQALDELRAFKRKYALLTDLCRSVEVAIEKAERNRKRKRKRA